MAFLYFSPNVIQYSRSQEVGLISRYLISESRRDELCFIIGLGIHQHGVRGGAKTEGEKEPRRWRQRSNQTKFHWNIFKQLQTNLCSALTAIFDSVDPLNEGKISMKEYFQLCQKNGIEVEMIYISMITCHKYNYKDWKD